MRKTSQKEQSFPKSEAAPELSEEKQRIHELLMDADFWLAHLEDFTKGEAGNDITKLRAKIEREMRPF